MTANKYLLLASCLTTTAFLVGAIRTPSSEMAITYAIGSGAFLFCSFLLAGNEIKPPKQ